MTSTSQHRPHCIAPYAQHSAGGAVPLLSGVRVRSKSADQIKSFAHCGTVFSQSISPFVRTVFVPCLSQITLSMARRQAHFKTQTHAPSNNAYPINTHVFRRYLSASVTRVGMDHTTRCVLPSSAWRHGLLWRTRSLQGALSVPGRNLQIISEKGSLAYSIVLFSAICLLHLNV